ncbi:hypothetical protein [Actinoplanes sp. NPDC051411]|uniref:hypothetical protein n=1 Tax=Actinoplanes sp. NPDC051411 TaxID=3155522 RepID=UPI003440D537
MQTRRHRDYSLPITTAGRVVDTKEHVRPPSGRATLTSLGLTIPALGVAMIWLPARCCSVWAAPI